MQTRKQSLCESAVNTAFGFIVSLFTNILVLPLFDIHVDIQTDFYITIIFTVVSLIRSYVIRRFFNRRET